MKNCLLTLILLISPIICQAQDLVPYKTYGSDYGYKNRLGEYMIQPQFQYAGDFIDGLAIVGYAKKQEFGNAYDHYRGMIDVNGDIVIPIKHGLTTIKLRYPKAHKIIEKRRRRGAYDATYQRIEVANRTADSLNAARIEQRRLAQLEQKRQDSIATAQRELEIQRELAEREREQARRDSIANARRVADSVWLAQEHKINVGAISGQGISLRKIKITGDGLLLRKDEAHRIYSITRDDFNRYHIAHDGDVSMHGVLDVKKVIYESDLKLLPDELFHSIEIMKATVEISQGARTKKFGAFSLLITLNLDDLDIVHTNEAAATLVLNSISHVEKYIASFIDHYQSAAHFVEPLFQVKVGGREGVDIGISDKQGNGASLEEVKRICTQARQKLAIQQTN